jgi:tetratricopeptide (TPR) repeat protein
VEGNLQEATSSQERARKILEALVGEQPVEVQYRVDLARAYNQLGLTHSHAGRWNEAEASLERARGLLEGLENQRVEGQEHRALLALVYNHLGMLFRATQRPDQALDIYERGLALQQGLALAEPDDPWARNNLGALYHNIGNLRRESGRGGSTASYQQAVAVLEPLVRDYHSIPEFRMSLARSLGNLAVQDFKAGPGSSRISTFTRVAELERSVVIDHPGVVAFVLDLVKTLFNLADEKLGRGQVPDALKDLQEATERLKNLLARSPDLTGRVWSLLGVTWEKRAEVLIALKREDEAVGAYQAAIPHQRTALDHSPQSAEYRDRLFAHYYDLAALQLSLDRAGEAEKTLRALEPFWGNDPGDLLEHALRLARAWPKSALSQGQAAGSSATAAEKYGELVVMTIERSLRAGLRDFGRLIHDPALLPFRSRADFQALLLPMMDEAFPPDPFRSW